MFVRDKIISELEEEYWVLVELWKWDLIEEQVIEKGYYLSCPSPFLLLLCFPEMWARMWAVLLPHPPVTMTQTSSSSCSQASDHSSKSHTPPYIMYLWQYTFFSFQGCFAYHSILYLKLKDWWYSIIIECIPGIFKSMVSILSTAITINHICLINRSWHPLLNNIEETSFFVDKLILHKMNPTIVLLMCQ